MAEPIPYEDFLAAVVKSVVLAKEAVQEAERGHAEQRVLPDPQLGLRNSGLELAEISVDLKYVVAGTEPKKVPIPAIPPRAAVPTAADLKTFSDVAPAFTATLTVMMQDYDAARRELERLAQLKELLVGSSMTTTPAIQFSESDLTELRSKLGMTVALRLTVFLAEYQKTKQTLRGLAAAVGPGQPSISLMVRPDQESIAAVGDVQTMSLRFTSRPIDMVMVDGQPKVI